MHLRGFAICDYPKCNSLSIFLVCHGQSCYCTVHSHLTVAKPECISWVRLVSSAGRPSGTTCVVVNIRKNPLISSGAPSSPFWAISPSVLSVQSSYQDDREFEEDLIVS